MASKVRTHIGGDATSPDAKLAPKQLSRQQFAHRLYQLMQEKGWHAAELARRSGLARDAISTYLNARSMPTPVSLKKLSTALGVKAIEILPNHASAAILDDEPQLDFKMSANNSTVGWLKINRLVTVETGLKIMELLRVDKASDRA